MAFAFNADEVFAIGEKIEENGEMFYREASKRVDDVKLKGALADLARQESAHIQRFQLLRSELGKEAKGDATFDPEGEAAMYLQATADSHVFSGEIDPDTLFGEVQAPRDALRIALRFEKDSIVFYIGMKKLVGSGLGADAVDWLIEEEMTHVRQIISMMDKY